MPHSPQDLYKKVLGAKGEKLVVAYLKKKGCKILERNYRTPFGEADIIAQDGEEIAFVEVKTRTYTKETLETAPPPGNAVKSEKQRLTRRAAKDYLWQNPTQKQPRMDVIEIWLMRDENTDKIKVVKINHIKAAY